MQEELAELVAERDKVAAHMSLDDRLRMVGTLRQKGEAALAHADALKAEGSSN